MEIRKAEFGNFTVPVNNPLVCLTSSFVFLATNTLLCVLIKKFLATNVWPTFSHLTAATLIGLTFCTQNGSIYLAYSIYIRTYFVDVITSLCTSFNVRNFMKLCKLHIYNNSYIHHMISSYMVNLYSFLSRNFSFLFQITFITN